MRVGNWNVEWADRSPVRRSRAREVIRCLDAEVLCITEACLALLPAGGHLISSDASRTYKEMAEDERQVLLWGRAYLPTNPHGVDSTGFGLGLHFYR